MPKDGDLLGWRDLARISEVEMRKWQTLERALYPSRVIEKLRLMQEELYPNRLIEKHRLIEDALHSHREQLRLLERALYPKDQIASSLRLVQALRPNQYTKAIREAGRVDWIKSLEAQQGRFRSILESTWRELQRSQDILARQQRTAYISALQETVHELINQNASALGAYDVKIGPKGEITLGGETTTSEEVAGELERLTQGLAAVSTVTACLQYLQEFFNSLRGPVKVVLLQLVLGWVINLTTPIAQTQWKRLVGASREEAVLALRETAKSNFAPGQLEGYRFVKSNRLRVHAAREGKDDVTAELAFGKLVRVLNIQGQRTQVEFLNVEGDAHVGWVATRYLGSFIK